METGKIIELIEQHEPTIQHFGYGRYSFVKQLEDGTIVSAEGTFGDAAKDWATQVTSLAG